MSLIQVTIFSLIATLLHSQTYERHLPDIYTIEKKQTVLWSAYVGDILEISFQLKLTEECPDGWCWIFRIGSDNARSPLINIYSLDQSINIYFSDSNDWKSVIQATPGKSNLIDGQWHYLYMKFSSTERIFIFDDKVYHNITNKIYDSSSYINKYYKCEIIPDNIYPKITGKIKDIRIYSRDNTPSPTLPSLEPSVDPTQEPTLPTTAIPSSLPTTSIPSWSPTTANPTTKDPTTRDPTTRDPTTRDPTTSPITHSPTTAIPTTSSPTSSTSMSPTTALPTFGGSQSKMPTISPSNMLNVSSNINEDMWGIIAIIAVGALLFVGVFCILCIYCVYYKGIKKKKQEDVKRLSGINAAAEMAKQEKKNDNINDSEQGKEVSSTSPTAPDSIQVITVNNNDDDEKDEVEVIDLFETAVFEEGNDTKPDVALEWILDNDQIEIS